MDSHTISSTSSEAIATGPGQMNFECVTTASVDALEHSEPVAVTLSLGVVGAFAPLVLTFLLEPARAESHESFAWLARIAA